ncbi:hypothetical protein HS088_TW19G00210 [Tripterygium wilfordii]|uniref:Uncharacterized protein n=1 Tax=Tripterygium wilfordii TaxID=458696 RepID=A0A7J7C8Z9_TRIWF|nr:uncharacterized protein LOC119985134 [Tripterygium wilfordii]KAF5730618.1 hypothetical protein HS088_TW19G00210 [Tripterygium wilfordii]
MDVKKGKDHWAFLEDIEAPMWVDLTLGSEFCNKDIGDQWFYTSHPFHQCSSHQLKSTIFHPFEESTASELEMEGPSSPKIPGSVSRSRGKHYRKKKWSRYDDASSVNMQHPFKNLKGKSSLVNLGNNEEIQPKSSFVNAKGILGNLKTRTCLFNKKDLTNSVGANGMKATLVHGDSKTSSCSVSDEVAESNTSTVTYESSQQQQQKLLEVSSQAFGQTHTSGLLSAVKISLRKSCINRKPSRVLINNESVQSGDQPSSSSNSNVGSSLTTRSSDRRSTSSKSSVGSTSNPVSSVKSSTSTSVRKKQQAPCGNNVVKMTQAAKNKVKHSNVARASTFRLKEGISGSRRGNTCNVRKAVLLEPAKSTVHYQNPHAKVSTLLGVKKEELFNGAKKAKEKLRVNRPNRYEGLGKENAAGRLLVVQRRNGGGNTAGAIVIDKRPDPKLLLRSGKTRLIGPKGKMSDRSEGTTGTNAVHKLYPR